MSYLITIRDLGRRFAIFVPSIALLMGGLSDFPPFEKCDASLRVESSSFAAIFSLAQQPTFSFRRMKRSGGERGLQLRHQAQIVPNPDASFAINSRHYSANNNNPPQAGDKGRPKKNAKLGTLLNNAGGPLAGDDGNILLKALRLPYEKLKFFQRQLLRIAGGPDSKHVEKSEFYWIDLWTAIAGHFDPKWPNYIRAAAIDSILADRAPTDSIHNLEWSQFGNILRAAKSSGEIRERLFRLTAADWHEIGRNRPDVILMAKSSLQDRSASPAERLAASDLLVQTGALSRTMAPFLFQSDIRSPEFPIALHDATFRLAIYIPEMASVNAAGSLIRRYKIPPDKIIIFRSPDVKETVIQKHLKGLFSEEMQGDLDRETLLKLRKRRIFVIGFLDVSFGSRLSNYWVLPYHPWKEGIPIKETSSNRNQFRSALGLQANDPLIVLNSPSQSDFEQFLRNIFPAVAVSYPNLRVISAFREVKHFTTAVKGLPSSSQRFRFIERLDASRPWPVMKPLDILAVHTMGEVLEMDAAADIVVVGRDRNFYESLSQRRPTLYFGDASDFHNNSESFERLTEDLVTFPATADEIIDILSDAAIRDAYIKSAETAVKRLSDDLDQERNVMSRWLGAAVMIAATPERSVTLPRRGGQPAARRPLASGA